MELEVGDLVAIDGDNIVVGASKATGVTVETGAVYVCKINENASGNILSISQVVKIMASGEQSFDLFGYSVAIRDKFILVGAFAAEKDTVVDAGAAYLFAFLSKDSNPPQWTQISKFQPDDLIANAWFRYSVAMDGNIAVIGTADSLANAEFGLCFCSRRSIIIVVLLESNCQTHRAYG
jgi:hypothetical protein